MGMIGKKLLFFLLQLQNIKITFIHDLYYCRMVSWYQLTRSGLWEKCQNQTTNFLLYLILGIFDGTILSPTATKERQGRKRGKEGGREDTLIMLLVIDLFNLKKKVLLSTNIFLPFSIFSFTYYLFEKSNSTSHMIHKLVKKFLSLKFSQTVTCW